MDKNESFVNSIGFVYYSTLSIWLKQSDKVIRLDET